MILGIILLSLSNLNAQGYLHADDIKIVNGNNENVLLRGIGTGNWMLMEGYMMKTAGVAGTQHEFRAKLSEAIGEEKTNEFFDVWLTNHFTRSDVDSMKAWGFNSVRAAMHYKWFTLPIEEEPISGENTWHEKGFVMIDSLLDWCANNEMYLILDMHGTPGGQGKNADICDYDPDKPSLWESVENQNKLTALWYKLAKRYANEPWIGGYDLINETNWDFENSGDENGRNCVFNIPLLEMHKRLIDTVRTIDSNHLVFVSGNSWGNNYSGMDELASYDDNLAYTFHKYWNSNNENDVDWITSVREELNVPLWMSESGENSNAWYTGAIHLFETNNIGWSWWPVKKEGVGNVLNVKMPESYDKVVKYWKGELDGSLSNEEIFEGVMDWAENHKIENCMVQFDVIDAMLRQPHTDETRPYVNRIINDPIFFSEFDFGKLNFSYSDPYHGNYGSYRAWNQGHVLRNDGIDIEVCDDAELNSGYSVGWTNDNEWMLYTTYTDSMAAYTLNVRHASDVGGSTFHIEVDGIDITGPLKTPGTSGWYNWETSSFNNIILPKGEVKLKFYIDKAGSNYNYFSFTDPKPVADVDFVCNSAKTSEDGSKIYLDLNKPITVNNSDIDLTEFELMIDTELTSINSAYKQVSPSTVLILEHDAFVYSGSSIKLSYTGSSVKSDEKELLDFSNMTVNKNLPYTHEIPGKIQAEDFIVNEGLGLGQCEDPEDGGLYTGWAKAGYYLIYRVHVNETSWYKLDYRVATVMSNAKLEMLISDDEENYTSVKTFTFSSTGKWDEWETQSTKVELTEGHYLLKLLVKQSEHNLNWFRLSKTTPDAINENAKSDIRMYPNPVSEMLILESKANRLGKVNIYSVNGKLVHTTEVQNKTYMLNTSSFNKGVYFVRIQNANGIQTKKLIVN